MENQNTGCKYWCKWYNPNTDECDYGYDTEKYYTDGCEKYTAS